MIRINLLGIAKPKKGKRGRFAMPKITTDGPSPLYVGLGVLALSCCWLYWTHRNLEATHEKLHVQIQDADRSIASMVKVKQAYLERQKEYDIVKRRFDVIDQLRASQVGPVPLLNCISETVNKTDGVWLHNMRDDGATVSLDGTALGANAVANLMTNLKNSGYFKDVELRETAQEDNPRLQTFSFTLVCEKAKA